ncbi:ANTAR domain-containing response regulator [Paenibacillus guangzhouensis]|uniref:ANTAR domain-containing response regulator n=1 Tax=Paenibacillus guangzhouensis TaxID=1473112 RepID=UPI001266D5A0|nr:response regulator [Paenibacillus guangzhouensis]
MIHAAAFNKSTLIVDDDALIRLDLREMLTEYGYQVVGEARHGEEAIELASRLQPALILMDVKMPGQSGIQAAKRIHKMSAHWAQGSPAIMLLTAYSDMIYVEQAKEAGVIAYLVKPVTEERLIPAVEVACKQREQFLQVKQEVQALRQSLEDRKWIDRAKGRLMADCGLQEEHAYTWLREQSMRERVSMAGLAMQLVEASWQDITDGHHTPAAAGRDVP